MTPPDSSPPSYARIRKAEWLLNHAAGVVAEEARRQCRPLRWRLDSNKPPGTTRSDAFRDAWSAVSLAAGHVGHRVALPFSAVPTAPQEPPVVLSPGPSRTRDYEYPPETPNQWSPYGHRLMLGRSGLDRETEDRHAAARGWSAENHGVGGIVDFRLIPGRHIDAHWHHAVCKVPATSSLDFRTWHHAQCASSTSSRLCDCSPVWLVRAGGAVYSIARDGALHPHVDPPVTLARIRWFDPSSPPVESGIRQGFQGEFDRDRFGRLLVPAGTPYLEFGNGTITFAEAGLPRPKIPPAACDHE